MEVGQRLFEARKRRGVTLDEISQSTKIPVSLLQAIERDDTARLPQGFFTRAFVRAYANEVGVNADDLLGNAHLVEIEEIAVEPPANVPLYEPSSSKSVFFAFALGVACTMFYSGFASPVQTPSVPPPVPVASPVDQPAPAAVAAACAPPAPAATPMPSVRRTASVVPSEKVGSAAQPIPVTHVVPDNRADTVAPAGESLPAVSDAVLPKPDPAPAEQF